MNENLTGLIGPDPQDDRDYQLLGASSVTNDFNEPSGLKEPPDENQGSSFSCTAQAFAYYFWQHTGIQLSRQDLYSRYCIPNVGGYIVDPFKMVAEKGNYDRKQHKDPTNQTEAKMIIKVDLPEGRRAFKITFWRPMQQDIDGTAWAIKKYKGVVGGVMYSKTAWADKNYPNPPSQYDSGRLGHALYFYDNLIYDNQKALKAKSSWCKTGHSNHIIKNDFFTTMENAFSFWVMEVKDISMNEFVETINNKGKVGIVVYADTLENYKFLAKQYQVDPKIKADGSVETDIKID